MKALLSRRLAQACVAGAWLAASLPVQAQADVRAGERLSEWLLRQQLSQAYAPGLMWQVPEERPAQEVLKNTLLGQLAQGRVGTADRARLSSWLSSLPVTGRVALAIPDGRWLQAHPDQDPVLKPGQTLRLPPRPATVTVVLEDGRLCRVTHVSGALARGYLQACLGDEAKAADTAWLAQADGRSRRFGMASWNEQAQDAPAPGAWLWAPRRDSGLDEAFSDGLIRFLASQGAAPDASGGLANGEVPVRAPAAVPAAKPRNLELTASDWGEIGLLQTPSARMADAGETRFQLSRVYPYTRATVMFQPLDWLEAGFRYTSISNRLYNVDLTGQSYKDKSIDLKLRLAKESAYVPEIALGMRDVGGTGSFSGEYLVANKRTGDLDWSLGLGWGYLGARGNLRNPLSLFSSSFDRRSDATDATGGTLNTSSYFHGPTALFGGVQWQTPWKPLLLKLEYDGNNYQHEPLSNNLPQKTPVNVGMVYRYSPGIDLSAGIERGNKFMLSITLHGGLDKLQMPKVSDAPAPPFRAEMPTAMPAWQRTVGDIEQLTGWTVQRIEQQGAALNVSLSGATGLFRQDRMERMLAVLHRDAPAAVRRFVFEFSERGMALHGEEVDRAAWIATHSEAQIPSLKPSLQLAYAPDATPLGRDADAAGGSARQLLWKSAGDRFTGGLGPSFSQSIGGPDGFILYQAGIQGTGEYRFSDSTWLSANLNARLIDNYNKFKYDAPSELPRVRTYIREYVTSSRLTLPNLQLTHARQISDNQFVSVYGGLLESMFAGVGAEWMYRPWRSPVALGVDVNRVQQRGFRQDFSLRDYSVNTGHVSLYWDTGWQGVTAKLSAGQYLAGDRGATLDVSRRFGNGVIIGAYATKTNVSAAQFGEGSFDKGVYVSMPFDVFMPKSSPYYANFNWMPLLRDGGAKLARSQTLYGLTSERDPQGFSFRFPHMGDGSTRTGDALFSMPADLAQPPGSLLGDIGRSARLLGRQLTDGSTAPAWLWAAGAVLASTALDRPADRWAQNHQGGRWNQAGKLASAIPVALGLGAGALSLGLGGDMLSETAWTSLKAAGFTLAGNTALRYAVGRARPDQNLGSSSFSGFNSGALQSGFASNHVGVAFALVTPFAQQYSMPWLYGLASLTALGRVQQRQHWVSDTVAGGVLGYAMGSLLLDQQRAMPARGQPRIALGLQSVSATWDFN
jgi:membrane-associated phospholipid phosphatase